VPYVVIPSKGNTSEITIGATKPVMVSQFRQGSGKQHPPTATKPARPNKLRLIIVNTSIKKTTNLTQSKLPNRQCSDACTEQRRNQPTSEGIANGCFQRFP